MNRVFQAEYKGDLSPYDFERKALAEIGVELVIARCADGLELIDRAADAEVLWIEWTPPVDHVVLEKLPGCRLVMRWGTGYDQIDVEAATQLGVAVANAPHYGTENVAEHTMALLLALARGVCRDNERMSGGGWRDPTTSYQRLSGHTLGVLGLGRIGRRVASLGVAFGCRVVAHDPLSGIEVPVGVTLAGPDEVVATSEYLCIHVPLDRSTRHMVNADMLARARPDLLLVNTSRGPVVDEAALLAALDAGQIAGAALDVFEVEPLPVDSPLRAHPKVILTPHEASESLEATPDLREEMCRATIEWFATGWTESVVNPEVRANLRPGARP